MRGRLNFRRTQRHHHVPGDRAAQFVSVWDGGHRGALADVAALTFPVSTASLVGWHMVLGMMAVTLEMAAPSRS